MNCIKCKKQAIKYFESSHWLCNRCYCEVLEKRIKRQIKSFNICKNDTLYAKESLCRILLKKMIKLPVRYVKSPKAKHNIISWTLDDECIFFLDKLLDNKKKKGFLKNTKKLFLTISNNDLNHYTELQNIKYNKKKCSEKIKILKSLEKIQPNIRNSMLKSIQELKNKGIY